jgi:hypothetical protein
MFHAPWSTRTAVMAWHHSACAVVVVCSTNCCFIAHHTMYPLLAVLVVIPEAHVWQRAELGSVDCPRAHLPQLDPVTLSRFIIEEEEVDGHEVSMILQSIAVATKVISTAIAKAGIKGLDGECYIPLASCAQRLMFGRTPRCCQRAGRGAAEARHSVQHSFHQRSQVDRCGLTPLHNNTPSRNTHCRWASW